MISKASTNLTLQNPGASFYRRSNLFKNSLPSIQKICSFILLTLLPSLNRGDDQFKDNATNYFRDNITNYVVRCIDTNASLQKCINRNQQLQKQLFVNTTHFSPKFPDSTSIAWIVPIFILAIYSVLVTSYIFCKRKSRTYNLSTHRKQQEQKASKEKFELLIKHFPFPSEKRNGFLP